MHGLDPEGVYEEGERRPAEQRAGQGAGHCVLELAGDYVFVGGNPRVGPEVAGEHLGDGELGDLTRA
jgi:hypothetical protein